MTKTHLSFGISDSWLRKLTPIVCMVPRLTPVQLDERLGQSTTPTGRCIAKHMHMSLTVIAGEYDSTGKAIVYGDTDPPYVVRILLKDRD